MPVAIVSGSGGLIGSESVRALVEDEARNSGVGRAAKDWILFLDPRVH
jgi:hypothetical protein